MKRYSLTHLSGPVLLRDCEAVHARERSDVAEALAHIAEVDRRKEYVPAGYDSLAAYCIGALRLSDDAAFKRIKAARAAQRFPAIFAALADGRLHLSAVVLLAPHLTEDTADDLLAAAAGKRKSEIERLVAERFARPDLLAWVETMPAAVAQQAPGPVGADVHQQAPGPVDGESGEAPAFAQPIARRQTPASRPSVTPLAPGRFGLQFSVGQSTLDDLSYAHALASHQIPSGDVAEVFGRALKAYIRELERTKFAATTRPRPGQRRPSASARHIPAAVKRAVWERDQGRCAFVSEAGHRCEARRMLEFDHVDPVCRGGQATVAGIRLRCRAHNQFEAERMLGAGFMAHKREEARRRASRARDAVTARATDETGMAPAAPEAEEAKAAAEAAARARESDVIPWLRGLGFRAAEARAAAALCDDIPEAPLEQRVRVALTYFHRRRPASNAHPATGGPRTAA